MSDCGNTFVNGHLVPITCPVNPYLISGVLCLITVIIIVWIVSKLREKK